MSTRGGKLLSLILAGTCAVLFLLALALQVGVGRGYTWLEPEADGPAVSAAAIDRAPFKLPAETEYAATQQRPLFNEDRKPTPEESGDDSTAAPQPPSAPLNVALTGVVLTPDLRVATLQDKTKNNATVVLKEGMPMPGDQGGWTLTHINPRSAIFRELAGEEIEVELTTAVANPRAGAPARAGAPNAALPGTPAAPRAPNAGPAVTPANPQSEALQRRIEERRKQMRDEAERMKQQQQQQPAQPEQ